MKVYTYSEARQRLADVLNIARTEEVVIKRRGGETFSIIFRKSPKSPPEAYPFFLLCMAPSLNGWGNLQTVNSINLL